MKYDITTHEYDKKISRFTGFGIKGYDRKDNAKPINIQVIDVMLGENKVHNRTIVIMWEIPEK